MSTRFGMLFIAALGCPIPVAISSYAEDVSPADVLRDAIFPFNPGKQRAAFLNAAGPDMLLSESEFKKESEKRTGFVRVYDTWDNLRLFDKDESGELDSLEAQEYRTTLRNAVLAKYDLNRNRHLEGLELAAASRDLTRGIVPKLLAPGQSEADTGQSQPQGMNPPHGQQTSLTETQRRVADQFLSSKPPNQETFQADLFRAFDLDGDKQFSDEENKALNESLRLRQLELWDRNGNGEMDTGEWGLQMLEQHRQKLEYLEGTIETRVSIAEKLHGFSPEDDATGLQTRRLLEMQRDQLRGQLNIIHQEYDLDRDGTLSDSEAAAWQTDKQPDEMRYWDRVYPMVDRNHNGESDGDEYSDFQQRTEMLKDGNGDGRISVAEEIQWMERSLDQFDANHDGFLSEKEELAAREHTLGLLKTED